MPLVTDREKCSHLLRRFGLGASEAELDFYLRDGLSGAIEMLLDYDKTIEGFDVDIDEMKAGKNQTVNMPGVVGWWGARLMATRRPLQEKMTLFWHDHFATSASKVQGPYLMFGQNEILRKNATGSFHTLLSEVSKDPAMLLWLDNQENVSGHANENFAREVMELFTLGIGNYSEKDVQEGARAFTGWSLKRTGSGKRAQADFFFRPLKHDTGAKNYLGNSGNLNGDDVLNILCGMPRTSEYITSKILNWFMYSDADEATVQRFTKVFTDSSLDIKTLLRAIMKSSDFYSTKAERTVVKNPVDFCISTLRQLGVGEVVGDAFRDKSGNVPPGVRLGPVQAAVGSMKSMGMWLMYPPDVSGWDGGQAWITSATMVERIGWAERIFGQAKNVRFQMRYPAYELFAKDPSPRGVVTKLVSIFDAPIHPEKLPMLVSVAEKASGGEVTRVNANLTAAAVSRLIFATPEFQFC